MQTVLVADDDAHVREVVGFALQKAGFQVREAASGRAALAAFQEQQPDLVILDVGMPDMEGTQVCQQIRLRSRVPLMFLSGRDEEFDRVLGLEIGADDYLCKPVATRELVARARALLRRAAPEPAPIPPPADAGVTELLPLRCGYLLMDEGRHLVAWNGREVSLTATEFALLRRLLKQPGYVVERAALVNEAYGTQVTVCERTIDSHLRRIRQKFRDLGGAPIDTVHGVGYRLNRCDRLE